MMPSFPWNVIHKKFRRSVNVLKRFCFAGAFTGFFEQSEVIQRWKKKRAAESVFRSQAGKRMGFRIL
jgi:hypothetical protein